MKKKKSKTKQKFGQTYIILLSVVGLVLVGIIFHFFPLKAPLPGVNSVGVTAETNMPPYLPAQYSDTHITANAIATLAKFKNISMTNTNDFLANAGSALGVSVQKSVGAENGTWLWTPILQITKDYQNQIIAGAKQNGIKNIYVSIDSYLDIFVMPDGADKTAKKKQFTDTLENFVIEAHKNGITVDAEGGWRNWAETGNAYKAFAIVSYAMEFNKTEPEKLRGFQYDVEPYLLDTYEKNKAAVLGNFVSLVNQTVSMMSKSDLQLSVVIPEFYDGSGGNTPSFTYQGTTGYTLDHLLDVLDERP